MQAHAAALAAVQAHFNTPQNSFGGRGSGPLAMQAIQEQVWQICNTSRPMLRCSYARVQSCI